MTIIWCMVSWDMERDQQKFLPFYPLSSLKTQKIRILRKWKNTWGHYHFTHLYHKWQSYHAWFLINWAHQTCFVYSYPTKNLQNQNFEKMKKKPGHIILQMSTKNDINILCTINHMMYGSWGMERKYFFCHFGLIFALLHL